MSDTDSPVADAATFLLAAHERAVALAEAGTRGEWIADGGSIHVGHPTNQVVDWAYDDNAPHIALHSPDSTLLRVAEERNILAEHEGTWASGEPEYGHHHEVMVGPTGRTRYVDVDNDEPDPPYMCITCEAPGYPCRTVIGLARAWGWKESTDG